MQRSLFDGNYEFKINKPIRLIELFAGIGAQAKALENLGIHFEPYRVVEIDKYAIKSYNAIHGTDFEPSDITKLKGQDLGITETDKYSYILTYSFPCQDLSLAGKQKGMAKGENTRSGLLWEVERLLRETDELPQVLLMENVPQVHGNKNKESFYEWLNFLERIGYKNYWKDLNAKDFGIPQNRNRCFMVSLLGDYYYEFPSPVKLEKRLKDVLEKEVDEKYYLSEEAVKTLNLHKERHKTKGHGFGWNAINLDRGGVAHSIKTESGWRPEGNFIIEQQGQEGREIHGDSEHTSCERLQGIRQPSNERSNGIIIPPQEIDRADGILLGKSKDFQRGNYPEISRTITTVCGSAGVVEWKKYNVK